MKICKPVSNKTIHMYFLYYERIQTFLWKNITQKKQEPPDEMIIQEN